MSDDLAGRVMRLETQREDHEKVHALEEAARRIALNNVEHRLSEHNEHQKQIESERGLYVLKSWYESRHEDLLRRINALELLLSGETGRQEPIYGLFKWIAGILAVVLAALVVAYLMKH